MSLKSTLQDDLKSAMRAKDSLKLGALRMLIAEIKKREIDKRVELDDAEVQKVISSLLKQRQDSIEAFRKGGRDDLADNEAKEADLLKAYLPTMLDRSAVEAIVVSAIAATDAKGPADIGKVMKEALAKSGGRADGKLVNEIVKAKLSGA